MIKENSCIKSLIAFSFKLIEQNGTLVYGRIPYLLFSDLLEGQTIENAEKLWDLVEYSIGKLTDPESFRTGKFIILKACNTLLRRLSKSCNPEVGFCLHMYLCLYSFCGRVLMALL